MLVQTSADKSDNIGWEETSVDLRFTISDSPTSDNLTPQETTKQDAPEKETNGGD
jgi:hypothetical protein